MKIEEFFQIAENEGVVDIEDTTIVGDIKLEGKVFRKGIKLLEGNELEGEIVLRECKFLDDVNLEGGIFYNNVKISGCAFFGDLLIGFLSKKLLIQKTELQGGISFVGSSDEQNSGIFLFDNGILGNIDFSGHDIGLAVRIIRCQCHGSLILGDAKFEQDLSILESKIKNVITFQHYDIGSGCEIMGNVFTDDPEIAQLLALSKVGVYTNLQKKEK